MTDSSTGAGNRPSEPGTSCAKSKKAFKDITKAYPKRPLLTKVGTV